RGHGHPVRAPGRRRGSRGPGGGPAGARGRSPDPRRHAAPGAPSRHPAPRDPWPRGRRGHGGHRDDEGAERDDPAGPAGCVDPGPAPVERDRGGALRRRRAAVPGAGRPRQPGRAPGPPTEAYRVSVVEVADVTKRFGPRTVVDRVSFQVAGGQVLALVGPSGSGKSTLLRMIAGLEAPDTGTIRLGGQIVAGPGRLVPPERRRVGLVFQSFALFPHLTVEDN